MICGLLAGIKKTERDESRSLSSVIKRTTPFIDILLN